MSKKHKEITARLRNAPSSRLGRQGSAYGCVSDGRWRTWTSMKLSGGRGWVISSHTAAAVAQLTRRTYSTYEIWHVGYRCGPVGRSVGRTSRSVVHARAGPQRHGRKSRERGIIKTVSSFDAAESLTKQRATMGVPKVRAMPRASRDLSWPKEDFGLRWFDRLAASQNTNHRY